MSAVWEKLFRGGPTPANDASPSQSSHGATGEENDGSPRAHHNPLARALDLIGRRNEALRAELESVEYAFSNIETIRTHFHALLSPVDEILHDIERANTKRLDAESKLGTLIATHEKLKGEHAQLVIDHNSLSLRQTDLSALSRDLEAAVARTATELNDAKSNLATQSARAERLERELEDSKRRLGAVSEQMPSLRAEFTAKEKRLQEIDQVRTGLEDRYNLSLQETRSLRARIEEMVANASKLNRQISETEGRHADALRRIAELETALAQEAAAHGKLKTVHFDDAEAHRLAVASLREEINALSVRSEGAERLLGEARAELRERNAAIRSHEQNAREAALALQSHEQTAAELEKSLAATHGKYSDADASRIALETRVADNVRELEARATALKRAQDQIAALEARMAEETKHAMAERESRDAVISKLRADLETQTAERAFAEGALHSARNDRAALRRAEGNADAAPEKLGRLSA